MSKLNSQKSSIPVVFALHDESGNYWVNTAVALCSVAMHASKPAHFFLMHDNTLSDQARDRLANISQKFGCSLTFMKIEVPSNLTSQIYGHFSVASLFRLLIPQAFKSFDRVIYLDSDLVCNHLDIATLMNASEVNSLPLSAVIDPYIGIPKPEQEDLMRLGLDASHYINSGVLVFRPKLISQNLIAEFISFQAKVGKTIHPDQDFLNVFFKGRIEFLSEQFNHQACLMNNSLFQDLSQYRQKIVHFAGNLKPLNGTLAPGFLPFWMHAGLVPEVAILVNTKNQFRYAFPTLNEPNSLVRKVLKPQPRISRELT